MDKRQLIKTFKCFIKTFVGIGEDENKQQKYWPGCNVEKKGVGKYQQPVKGQWRMGQKRVYEM